MKNFPWDDLIKWYTKCGRHDLPWRDYSLDQNTISYRVWLSEILLQQTQVERVRSYFVRILDTYPTIHDLAGASYDEFFPYYQGMGYYSRARNLLKTAQIVSNEYSGVFPQEREKLIKLPGVGGYTTEAIRGFGYNISTLAWDTNLEKVFARYYNGRKDIKLSGEEKRLIENDLENFLNVSGKSVRDINNALMDFSATTDLKNPENIDWENYPIQSGLFYETCGKMEPKEVRKSLVFPTPDATIIVTLHKDHKVYYSEGVKDLYSDFILPPALHRDTRKYVQDYFRDKFQLEVSVRPAHKKWISEDGKPYIAVNTQIQAGDVFFDRYDKKGRKIIDSCE